MQKEIIIYKDCEFEFKVNGKIVYSDNTTDKKPIISSEIKQLFKDYFQQKMSKKKSQDEK